MTPLFLAQIVLTLFVFVMLLNSAAIMVYVERKVAALLQQRLGPYLVGPRGLLQPIADVVKLMFKEELRPAAADAFLFALAPNGTTAKAEKAAVAEMIGASANSSGSAARGRSSSLNISLMTSANGCSSPCQPTRVGPMRCCSSAATRRSTHTIAAAELSSATKMNSVRTICARSSGVTA